ncbi:hypothetical protein QAD02_012360 [Eretmocerus hayati]|uniref:Uncharacterized protein n=1 Tax=Eretmocerus hayati TaxID=131215 RepID=A0ACC2P0C4_9HYME|nr:hypothetical protein QAD02_012360 [Eretmocerus hayati]
MGLAGPDSGSSAPSSVPHSLATSRDEEDEDDEESSGRRSNGHGGSRTKSNQRWMKLRTTVQLSSAISTIQKKPTLKREDSFLKRFSTRQIPESQETIDTGEGEGDQSDEKNENRRRRRPRRPQKPPKTVVNPDENFYYYWLMVLSACVLYNLWTLIVRQSMPELQESAPAVWLTCDSFTDLVFFLDVGVQFRTGYLEQGLMVYNTKKLAGHYFKSKSFLLDLLALLPLDLLQVNFGSNPMLRFPRFLKVYRVYNYYYMVESRTVYPNFWRVLNLIHILLILAHWFGCFYYLLSEAEGFHGDWVYPYRPGEYATLTRKYLGSLYWSTLTLTTIGDLPTPETNAEYIFTIVSYLIGVFIFATIVGQVGNVITNRNANRLEFERLLDGAKTYMRHHKVPGGMKRRVLRWYDYSWSRGRIQGGGDINTALGLLPDKLKTELALHVNLTVLKKVTIFQECQPEFLHDLVLKMKAYIFTPGDSICRKGEVAREMFIIADGILEVISETGRVLTTMKAGDFFGEIGILNLDGLNKRTADVRSVGYSELFSLSREDVLAALKDYPEAQEILRKLGEKRLREAQRVARSFRQQPPSPGHDSSDNSTGKRIVDKLKSDVKGLKSVLRKSRRTGKQEDGMELQPLTTRVLRRQMRIDESQDVQATAAAIQRDSEPPVSPLGAGLPLLSRLRLLKEKQDREERKNLVEMPGQAAEQVQTTIEVQAPACSSSSSGSVPLLQRLWHMKSKAEPDPTIDRESVVVKEPLLPRSVIPEESEVFVSTEEDEAKVKTITTTKFSIRSPPSSSADIESDSIRKPWAMLKDASLKTGGAAGVPSRSSVRSAGSSRHGRHVQIRQSLVHIRQQTKMYASVDDLSPEYCGLPFVKKLKILNERQKLAELEKVVRSSSLDCGENADAEFDGSLTRSHSEACAIEYARKLAKLNKERRKRRRAKTSSEDQLSPENETLERRNLKSILKKLSASSRASSSEVQTVVASTSAPPDEQRVEATRAEMRKLMRAPTIEGYAARHSKLSKSVTFNKYTLQSPPGTEQVTMSLPGPSVAPPVPPPLPPPPPPPVPMRPLTEPSTSTELATSVALVGSAGLALEQQQTLDRVSFCPASSLAAVVTAPSSSQALQTRIRDHAGVGYGSIDEEEYMGELVSDLRDVVQARMENIQGRFERQCTSLELEIRKRDEIISQLQARIQQLEKPEGSREDGDSLGDSTEHDASMEDDLADDNDEHPFMRDGSVDTVLNARPRRRYSSPSSTTDSSTHNRRSWEEHSEEETLELQDLPRSITPQPLWRDDVAIDLPCSDDEAMEGTSGLSREAPRASESFDDDDDDELVDENGHNNWEVAMLAQELEKRRRSSEGSSPGS